MTAEIAILNKVAVALAADSAVTIGRGAMAKIYNTVSKIFELSETCPVGIMVFNRLDYMNIPLEVIIKEYRRSRRNKAFKRIEEWRDDFINYLSKEVPYVDKDENENVYLVVYDAMDGLNKRFEEKLSKHLSATKKYLTSKFNGILKTEVTRSINELKSKAFAPGFNTKKLPAKYDTLVEGIATHKLKMVAINQGSMNKLKEYVGYVLAKSELSSFKTGLVIAGFGDDEIFPTLTHTEIDGVIDGRLKRIDKETIDIDRKGTHAEIRGFAQDDMVQSFVNGVDPLYRQYVGKLIRSAIEETAKSVATPLQNNAAATDALIAGLQANFDTLSADYSKKSDSYIDKKFTQEIKSMVRSMPKQDLANLAESLIEITSLKRKVTRERETVGGEVDVAVISKSEGLVWVRRKHYFPADLNARFFSRHFKVEN